MTMSTLVTSVLASAERPAIRPAPAGSLQGQLREPKAGSSLLIPVLTKSGVISLERRRAGL
jgi:hypothetical protein